MEKNDELFAEFFGLYLMEKDIPEELWEYVCNHETSSRNAKHAVAMLLGAPDYKDMALRKMVISLF